MSETVSKPDFQAMTDLPPIDSPFTPEEQPTTERAAIVALGKPAVNGSTHSGIGPPGKIAQRANDLPGTSDSQQVLVS